MEVVVLSSAFALLCCLVDLSEPCVAARLEHRKGVARNVLDTELCFVSAFPLP